LRHFLMRFVLSDRNVSLFGMIDVQCSNLAAFYFDRCRVFALVVDVMVAILFQIRSQQLFRIMMVLGLGGHRKRGIAHNQQNAGFT
jgi:hypothetical protein